MHVLQYRSGALIEGHVQCLHLLIEEHVLRVPLRERLRQNAPFGRKFSYKQFRDRAVDRMGMELSSNTAA